MAPTELRQIPCPAILAIATCAQRVTARRESGETQAGRNDERPFAPSLAVATLRASARGIYGTIEVDATYAVLGDSPRRAME